MTRVADPARPRQASPRDAAVAAVRTRGLGKRIDERTVLAGIDLDISSGSITALLGANGAGKSTLLRVLATLTPPTSGELELFGRRPTPDGAAVRSRIGLVGHQLMLYRDLSVLENLAFFGRLYGVPNPRLRAGELLVTLGVADRAADPVRSLSRGLAQRVAIARALMHSPRLLLADEPFTGLDVPSERLVERRLDDLRTAGVATVIASHDIRQSLSIADAVVVLRAGRVVLRGPAAAVDARTVLDAIQAPGGDP